MRRALPLFLLLLTVVGLLGGCQSQSAPQRLKSRERTYSRLVSLSPSTTEILISSLGLSSLAGRTASCNWPAYVVDRTPIVASVKPDWEKIRATSPDFIVYDSLLYSPQDVAKMKETGATVFGFNAKNLNDFRVQVFELANFVGGSSRASEYIDKVILARSAGTSAATEPRKKVAVLMAGGNGQYSVVGTDSFIADEIRAGGGDPVGPATDRFVPLVPESLVSMNPDVIIVPVQDSKDNAGIMALLKDPRFASVNAVKNRKIGAIQADTLLRMGGRVDKCIEAVTRILG